MADLKAYYESEIRALRDKLNLRDLPQDLEKSNQALRERCDHLERALTEASGRIQELETKNCTLEKKLASLTSTGRNIRSQFLRRYTCVGQFRRSL